MIKKIFTPSKYKFVYYKNKLYLYIYKYIHFKLIVLNKSYILFLFLNTYSYYIKTK